MSLSEGTKLGSYEITGQIGAGGMGEVYRATDTKLGREVAIKTLPAALASDKDRLARFEREAKLLAALNHPHIASVYSLDEHEGTLYLAMELVAGETLEEKLKPGALPIDDALRLALQIAEALEAAHEKGVVHRDLKPANIMVTPEGIIKVLDFGLAKAFSEDPNQSNVAQSPALSVAMTQQGLVLGTAAYMSPEQASGQPTDQRADIWSFGVVLYEMLTGLPLFSGQSVPHILADVLKTEPDWKELPKRLHPRVKLMLERCLTKKPRDRYHSIADARVDIQQVLNDPAGAMPAPVVTADAVPSSLLRRIALPIGFAVWGGIAGIVVWLTMLPDPLPEPQPSPVSRFVYDVPAGVTLRRPDRAVFALSPDGRYFVLNTSDGLLLRRMSELEATLIPGTEENLRNPFFSPDAQSVAYRTPTSDQIKRITITGGAPVIVASDVGGGIFGAEWAADGTLLIAGEAGINRVPASGGMLELVIPVDGGERVSNPQLLPDGDSVLFTSDRSNNWDTAEIVVASLATGDRTVVLSGGSDARYLPSGHLVYAYEDNLFGVAFDLGTLKISGGPVPLVQGVLRARVSGTANFDVSEDGTLFYLEGEGSGGNSLVWVDRNGVEEPINAPPRIYVYVQISPDGRQLALDIRDEDLDTWIWDLERQNLRRLSFDSGLNRGAVWLPDGERVAFSRALGATEEIYWQAWDGSGVPEPLTDGSGSPVLPVDFTPDGGTLIFTETVTPRDIWMAPVNGAPSIGMALISTPADEENAAISPDGRWIAYQSDESGAEEVYVRPFPDIDSGRWQVSINGGTRPQWRADGGELFYVIPGGSTTAVMSVEVEAEETFQWRTPSQLFEGPYLQPQGSRDTYAVSSDGQRFVMIKAAVASASAERPRVVIVQNWAEELERLLPVD